MFTALVLLLSPIMVSIAALMLVARFVTRWAESKRIRRAFSGALGCSGLLAIFSIGWLATFVSCSGGRTVYRTELGEEPLHGDRPVFGLGVRIRAPDLHLDFDDVSFVATSAEVAALASRKGFTSADEHQIREDYAAIGKPKRRPSCPFATARFARLPFSTNDNGTLGLLCIEPRNRGRFVLTARSKIAFGLVGD